MASIGTIGHIKGRLKGGRNPHRQTRHHRRHTATPVVEQDMVTVWVFAGFITYLIMGAILQ